MTTRTITAIYDSEADAQQARDRLVNVGLPDDDVRIVSHQLSSSPVSSDTHKDHKGVWESIKDFFVGDEDRHFYSEGMRRGGYLLTARVDDEHSTRAMDELEKSNAIDLDERSAQWRAEGWTATTAVDVGDLRHAIGRDKKSGGTDRTSLHATTSGATDRTSLNEASGSSATDEQAIPIVEERLRVGKREVDRGSVRVRSYIVEEPVHEEVSLRDEHVVVERRPATGAELQAGDVPLQERTIEMSERGEEPIVAKDAIVKEEVVVRRTEDERVESVDDTVRRTEVDINDTRDDAAKRNDGGGKSKKRPR